MEQPDFEYTPTRIGRKIYQPEYILGIDVGRFGCTTEVVVLKLPYGEMIENTIPQKQIVNIFTFDEENFIVQAIKIKRLFHQFKCKGLVVDANGIGTGLVDLLVIDTTDPDTGELLPGFGVINDEDGRYKNMYSDNYLKNTMYAMKANLALNSRMYAYCRNTITNGYLQFLTDETIAKEKLLGTQEGRDMSAVSRAEYLLPFNQTSILREQMLNLVHENDAANIVLKQFNTNIKKDKFSALIYALFWCDIEEEKHNGHKTYSLKDLLLFSHRTKKIRSKNCY